MTLLEQLTDPRAVSSAPPDGRAWRIVTVLRGPPPNRAQPVTELSDARARKLTVQIDEGTTAECVIDGRSPQCAALAELSQDLVFYRWNTATRAYDCLFRGPIGRTEDSISETTHTVNVAAADLRSMLARCVLNRPLTYTQVGQDQIVSDLVADYVWNAAHPKNLGLYVQRLNPDGTSRGPSGVLRDRTYVGSEKVGDMIDQLANVAPPSPSTYISSFEWEVAPVDPYAPLAGGGFQYAGYLNVYYPQRGVTKSFVADYGGTVASLTRTVNSTEFANWVRNDGQPDSSTTPPTPRYAVAAGDVMTNPQLHGEGFWPEGINNASTVDPNTLAQQAAGELAQRSQLIPSYTVNLAAGAWQSRADCWLGDTIRLRVNSGRLAVDTSVRVLGVAFDIDDAGQERIALTVGRTPVTFGSLMADQRSRLDALSRR
jgi:hypothetical protein